MTSPEFSLSGKFLESFEKGGLEDDYTPSPGPFFISEDHATAFLASLNIAVIEKNIGGVPQIMFERIDPNDSPPENQIYDQAVRTHHAFKKLGVAPLLDELLVDGFAGNTRNKRKLTNSVFVGVSVVHELFDRAVGPQFSQNLNRLMRKDPKSVRKVFKSHAKHMFSDEIPAVSKQGKLPTDQFNIGLAVEAVGNFFGDWLTIQNAAIMMYRAIEDNWQELIEASVEEKNASSKRYIVTFEEASVKVDTESE